MLNTPDNSRKTAATEVLIGGKIYSLAGGDPEYLQKVAALLNRKLAEVRSTSGYKNLDHEYRELLLNLNLADEYFMMQREAEQYREQASAMESELYTARHDLVSVKMKLENALKQQEVLAKRAEEWKRKYEERARADRADEAPDETGEY